MTAGGVGEGHGAWLAVRACAGDDADDGSSWGCVSVGLLRAGDG